MGPLIYLNSDENRTLPIGLLYFSRLFTQDYPKLPAATLVALIIPVVLYVSDQCYTNYGIVYNEGWNYSSGRSVPDYGGDVHYTTVNGSFFGLGKSYNQDIAVVWDFK